MLHQSSSLNAKSVEYCFKGPVCKIKGNLLPQMEYNIHKYVFIGVN